MPEPVAMIVVGEFVALLAKVILLVTLPAVWGVKATVRVTLAPAATVVGNGTPETLNPQHVVGACTVALVLPVFDKVTNCVAVEPTPMLPKLRLVVEAFNVADDCEKVEVNDTEAVAVFVVSAWATATTLTALLGNVAGAV